MELEELLNILSQFPDNEKKKELISKAEGLNAKTNYFKEKYSGRTDEEAVNESKKLEQEINEYSKITYGAITKWTDELKEKIKKIPKTGSNKKIILFETYTAVRDKKYENFEKAVSGLEYSLADIINLTQKSLSVPDTYGLYISALINKIIKPEDILPIQINIPLPYIGYKLKCGTVTVKGDVGYGAGEWMTGGRLKIDGKVGHGAGRIMEGGELILLGKAEGSVGESMKNGTIEAFSDVGDYIGSGMINGKITVHSKAGKSAGINMQGGLIELKSDTGDELGMELNGGHIIVYGKSGKNVGYNRKFGIIELLGGYESIGYTASGSEAQIHTG